MLTGPLIGSAVIQHSGQTYEELGVGSYSFPQHQPAFQQIRCFSFSRFLPARPLRANEHKAFIERIGRLAAADMQKSGVLASLTIAQAILILIPTISPTKYVAITKSKTIFENSVFRCSCFLLRRRCGFHRDFIGNRFL